MGKSSKAVKRRRLHDGAALITAVSSLPTPLRKVDVEDRPDDGELIAGLVLPEELQITIETLNTLSHNADVLRSKQFKDLKTAVWNFQSRWSDVAGAGSSLVSRISLALQDARYTDALVLLSELRIRGQCPKLGALQRWVRECDAASRAEGEIVWEVLEAILRTTGEAELSDERIKTTREDVVKRGVDWVTRTANGMDLSAELQSGELTADRAALAAPFLPLQRTPGPQRRPPNQHASTVYYSPSNPLALSASPATPVTRLDHPHLPGAFLLQDVLSQTEARKIVQSVECVGLEPDRPIGGSAKELQSVLADNMVWLADEEFERMLFGRIKYLLPQIIERGQVKGINRRFRIYRYVPGSTYRPHIDGAWPASSLSATTPPEYIYDSDPMLYSRLTLLLYLNDGFSGGCTTFFTPSHTKSGTLATYPVRPVMGAALLFPHGSTRGSLLHEGSGVLSGAKWVVRTEVLYEVGRDGRGGGDVWM